MARTNISWKVFTACLVTYTGLFLPVSWSFSCDPLAEQADLKTYRAPIVVEAFLNGTTAVLDKKTMKGEVGKRITQVQLTGFDSETPCTGSVNSFSQNTEYLLFIRETDDPGIFSLMGNPEPSSKFSKRAVRRVLKEGGPPSLAKRLKPKYMLAGDRLILNCAGKGMPMPIMYWLRNGERLKDNDVPRLKIKPSKRNVKLQIRNLDQALHEGTYSCVVTNTVDPPVIGNSTLSICAISCLHGQPHHKKCKCMCDEGYDGDLCEIKLPVQSTLNPSCQLNCGSTGVLHESMCTCSCIPGYGGPSCEDVVPTWTPLPISPADCSIDCGDHGQRDGRRCACLCDEGYSGANCTNDDAAMCMAGLFCENGGTCQNPPHLPGSSDQAESTTPQCICPYGWTGPRCEEVDRCPGLNCGDHGHLARHECVCICEGRYSGPTCSYQKDNHTEPCSAKYENYCLNGGTCHQLVGIKTPTCNCPDLYRGSPRCEFINSKISSKAPPVVHPSIEQNSMKVIITLTVIFISLLLVLLLVVFIYIKNKNYREAERRKRIKASRNILRPVNYNSHLAGQSGSPRVIQGRVEEMEMVPRRPSAPMTVMRIESDGSLHRTSSQRSRSIDAVRYTAVPTNHGANPALARTMHNGHARKISQASLQSNRSTTSHRSNASSPGSATGKRRRVMLGYEAVPVIEPADTIEEYRGDTAACEDASIIMVPRDEELGCSDDESECSSRGDDIVDVPNPTICAIETHLAQPGEDYDSLAPTETDFSADVVNANYSDSLPDASSMHSSPSPYVGGHSHRNAASSPQEVNLQENPLDGATASLKASARVPTNKLLNIDGYYGSSYEDEIDRSSPPHAV